VISISKRGGGKKEGGG